VPRACLLCNTKVAFKIEVIEKSGGMIFHSKDPRTPQDFGRTLTTFGFALNMRTSVKCFKFGVRSSVRTHAHAREAERSALAAVFQQLLGPAATPYSAAMRRGGVGGAAPRAFQHLLVLT
jgi:hypothetical protein